MFGFPAWLTIFLILYAVMIAGVWLLSFSNILFDEREDAETDGNTGQEKEAGGEV